MTAIGAAPSVCLRPEVVAKMNKVEESDYPEPKGSLQGAALLAESLTTKRLRPSITPLIFKCTTCIASSGKLRSRDGTNVVPVYSQWDCDSDKGRSWACLDDKGDGPPWEQPATEERRRR
eukprot:jgi/Botrbrau1/6698/Bobra.0202s0035.1